MPGRLAATPTTSSIAQTSEVVAYLMDSHARTRHLLATAVRVARDGAQLAAIADLATQMYRFFTFYNPLHELDEEQTVAPALKAFVPGGAAEPYLAPIVEEHVRLDRVRERLSTSWIELSRDPSLFDELQPELIVSTAELARFLGPHQAREERDLFPLIAIHIPSAHQATMMAVMRARRGGADEPEGVDAELHRRLSEPPDPQSGTRLTER